MGKTIGRSKKALADYAGQWHPKILADVPSPKWLWHVGDYVGSSTSSPRASATRNHWPTALASATRNHWPTSLASGSGASPSMAPEGSRWVQPASAGDGGLRQEDQPATQFDSGRLHSL